jgi:hypothetical protein
LKRRTDLEQATNQKPAFDGIRQIFGRSTTPVMEKHDARLFVRHVLMDGDDVDLSSNSSFKTGCNWSSVTAAQRGFVDVFGY